MITTTQTWTTVLYCDFCQEEQECEMTTQDWGAGVGGYCNKCGSMIDPDTLFDAIDGTEQDDRENEGWT